MTPPLIDQSPDDHPAVLLVLLASAAFNVKHLALSSFISADHGLFDVLFKASISGASPSATASNMRMAANVQLGFEIKPCTSVQGGGKVAVIANS